MQPQCRVTVDGKLVSGVFMDRLVSCEVTDQEGSTSDTVSIELHDFPPAAIPRKGAIIRVWMGYSVATLSYMGAFTVDQVRVTALPYTMSISGKGADVRKDAKKPTERHWDDKTIKDILGDLAGDMGVSLKVDEALGAYKYTWFGQELESALETVQRLANRHDAVHSVKDGKLIFVPKGQETNASGVALGAFTVTPNILVEGSAQFTFSDRTEVDKVKARYYDRDRAEMMEEEVAVDD